jgi:hypothetical protein
MRHSILAGLIALALALAAGCGDTVGAPDELGTIELAVTPEALCVSDDGGLRRPNLVERVDFGFVTHPDRLWAGSVVWNANVLDELCLNGTLPQTRLDLRRGQYEGIMEVLDTHNEALNDLAPEDYHPLGNEGSRIVAIPVIPGTTTVVTFKASRIWRVEIDASLNPPGAFDQ